MSDWMIQIPDPVPGDYRKRPERWRTWQPWSCIVPHRTDKRGRGMVGRLETRRRKRRRKRA